MRGRNIRTRESLLVEHRPQLPRIHQLRSLAQNIPVMPAPKPVSSGISVNTPEYVTPRNDSGASECVLQPKQLTACPVYRFTETNEASIVAPPTVSYTTSKPSPPVYLVTYSSGVIAL
jgi:hypothetical protein